MQISLCSGSSVLVFLFCSVKIFPSHNSLTWERFPHVHLGLTQLIKANGLHGKQLLLQLPPWKNNPHSEFSNLSHCIKLLYRTFVIGNRNCHRWNQLKWLMSEIIKGQKTREINNKSSAEILIDIVDVFLNFKSWLSTSRCHVIPLKGNNRDFHANVSS